MNMKLCATDFGKDFVWGVSSSAYQTEGAYFEDGKGLSIWDVFSIVPGKIADRKTGKVASDFYHRFIQDLILMQYLNIRNFRFSVSWPRLLPEGKGQPNDKGLDFYDALIDFCLECGIEPWITLYHWDLPQALERQGGWTNRDVIHWFSDYVSLCVKRYGDRVKHWMVLNEPLAFTGGGYFLGMHAPGRKGLPNFLAAMHHAVLCQAIGGKLLKDHNEQLKVGTTFSCSHVDPADGTMLSVEAARRVDLVLNRLFLEPLLGLGYPWQELKVLQQVQKLMYPDDEALMQWTADFVGLQNYTRYVVQHSSLVPYINARIVKPGRRKVRVTDMGWEIYPEGMYHILKKFAAYPMIPRLIVTENGAAFSDTITGGQVHDPERIQFYEAYLLQLLKAKKEGVPVDGYFAWSFTDNFEWAEGYTKRFGLVYVDFASQKRTIKSSGLWYRKFLEKQAMPQIQRVW